MGPIHPLHDRADDLAARRVREAPQLLQVLVGEVPGHVSLGGADEYRPVDGRPQVDELSRDPTPPVPTG